jgi:hypothetical protein
MEIDNRWIVPYNPNLFKKYRYHINVESCATIAAVKYLHKYVFKGHDLIELKLKNELDQVERHIAGRYLSCTEAIQRILEYPLAETWPHVNDLPVHQPGRKRIIFGFRRLTKKAIDAKNSKLKTWLNYNRDHTDGREYHYYDFPKFYIWISKDRCWKPRSRDLTLGSLQWRGTNAGEDYYLRYLLTEIKGACSWENLRTKNGHVYGNFKEAAAA